MSAEFKFGTSIVWLVDEAPKSVLSDLMNYFVLNIIKQLSQIELSVKGKR